MDQAVVSPAQQHQIRQRGGSAVRPVHHVVSVAPGGRTIAPGEPALSISDHHSSAHGGQNDWGPPHVQRLRAGAEDYPAHRGVTGPRPGGFMTDRSQVIELGGFSAAPECLKPHGHGHVGPLPADLRPIRGVQPPPADLSQGVGPALAWGSPILLVR